MRRGHKVLLVLGLCAPLLVYAQSAPPAAEGGTAAYLLRLERVHANGREGFCVLLGAAQTRLAEDHGTKLLQPLGEWLQTHIDVSEAVPSPQPANGKCDP